MKTRFLLLLLLMFESITGYTQDTAGRLTLEHHYADCIL